MFKLHRLGSLLIVVLSLLFSFSCDRGDQDPEFWDDEEYQAESARLCEGGGNSNSLVGVTNESVVNFPRGGSNILVHCHMDEVSRGWSSGVFAGIQMTNPDGTWGSIIRAPGLRPYTGNGNWWWSVTPFEPDCSSILDTETKSYLDFRITFRSRDPQVDGYEVTYRLRSCDEGRAYGNRWLTQSLDYKGDVMLRPSDGSPRAAHSRFKVVRILGLNGVGDIPVDRIREIYDVVGLPDGYVSGLAFGKQFQPHFGGS